MIKYIYTFFTIVFLFSCSCNDTTKCDTNEPLTIDFRLETNGAEQKLVNLSKPDCLIKKIQWDFDGDEAWDSEEESPSFPIGKTLGSVTLRINELNTVTKNINSINSEELSGDSTVTTSREKEEKIETISTTQPEKDNDSGHSYKSETTLTKSKDYEDDNTDNNPEVIKNEASKILTKYSVSLEDVPSTVFVGEAVRISAIASVTNGSIDSYDWLIDGVQLSGEEITHTFSKSGEVEVRLCVNKIRSCRSKRIKINESIPDTGTTLVSSNTSNSGSASVPSSTSVSGSTSASSIASESRSSTVSGNTSESGMVKKSPPAVCKVDFAIPSQVDQCEKIELNAISKDNGSRFEWVIGNDKKSGKNITYDFKKPGNYTINLCNKSSSDCCVSKSIVVKEVIEEDDDFYGKSLSNPIGSYTECDEKEWVSESNIKIKPSQSITLDKAVLWSSGGGKVIFILEYADACGETISNALSRNVNNGRSELLLNKFLPLSSSRDYILRIETQGDIKMLSNYNCNDMPNGDSRVKMDYQSGYSLFEIQYKY